jgi:CheY-like chemotaxis protein
MLPYAPQSTGCEPTPLDAVASDASERFAGATILIADDEDIVRQVAHAALEMAGFSVLQARDGEEAIEVFRNNADLVSLVILDMSMPRMGGEETFRALQRARPRVPVLLSSGFNEQDSTSRIAGRGFAGFIQKPYRPAELVTKVRQLLSRPPTGGGERPEDAPA